MSRPPDLSAEDPLSQIHVAAGVLRDSHRVLLSERMGDSAFAGLWEFPGGKRNEGEATETALKRELAEELGIVVTEYAHLLQVSHRYPDRFVLIDFFLVDGWRGEPESREGQALRWESIRALDASMLLPADAPVVKALKELSGQG